MPLDFLTTREGAPLAWELWELAKGTGTRPVDLLTDPTRLAIDLSVMRGSKAYKRSVLDQVQAQDKSGLGVIAVAQRILAEE